MDNGNNVFNQIQNDMGKIYQDCLHWLDLEAQKRGGAGGLAKELREPRVNLYKTLNKEKPTTPNAEKFLNWLNQLGARVVFPGEESNLCRDVKFVEPQVVGVKEYENIDARVHPVDDNYMAVPLVADQVAAGPGLIQENKISDWVIVYRYDEAIRGKSALVAVKIGKHQRSMIPTLHPGDIVLVNKGDRDPNPAGKVMLVIEPGIDGGVAIKRVSTQPRGKDTDLIFYSDNASEYPPVSYSLKEHYDNDISHAIAGRVVWSWSDMTKK